MKSKVLSSLSLLVGLSLTLGSCLDDDNIDPLRQLQADIKKIDAYLASNPPAPEHIIVKDAQSGIRMVITQQGTGSVPPTAHNIIQVAYTGRLFSNGQQFDASESFIFTLTTEDAGGDVIDGWKYALAMMTEGTRATVYIPSVLAYGSKGQGSIPENAILVFDMELLIVNTDNEEPRLTTDIGKIQAELEATPNVVNHPSGVSYILQPLGTGPSPGLYDHIRVKYTGRVLGGDVFAENIEQGPVNIFSSRVVNYLHGLIIGLQVMHEGDKSTIYIPSALGYGPSSAEGIPANSVLVFEMELLEVIPNVE